MASPFRRPRNYRRAGDDQVTSTLIGRRVALRALIPADFPSWQEVRRRNADWLVPWEPARTPACPTWSSPPEAFAMRCSARERERQLGTGFGFGIFVGGRFAGEINLSSVQRGYRSSAATWATGSTRPRRATATCPSRW